MKTRRVSVTAHCVCQIAFSQNIIVYIYIFLGTQAEAHTEVIIC